MGSSLTGIALKGVGALVVALLVLSVVGTVVGLVVGFVVTTMLLAVATVATVCVLAATLWLATSLLAAGTGSAGRERDRASASSDPFAQDGNSDSRSWRDRLPGGGADDSTDERDRAERLRERYVAGEIDEAEFERRLALLLETSDLTESGREPRSGGSNRSSSLRERLFE